MTDKEPGEISEDPEEEDASQTSTGDASFFHWCSKTWPKAQVTGFFEKFWGGQKDSVPEELLCLNHCLDCVERYHRDRKEVIESEGNRQVEGLLFTFECSLVNHFLTSLKHRLEIERKRKKLATDTPPGSASSGHQLPMVLKHILKYPFFLFLKDLHDLFVEVLTECLAGGEPTSVTQYPGLYLLLVHPNKKLHTWAKFALSRFGKIQLGDSSDLLRVVNVILSVLKFDLQSNPETCDNVGLEEPSRRIIVVPHLFNMSAYWQGLHTLLSHMDTALMGNVHGEIPLTILNSLLQAARSDAPEQEFFLQKMSCFSVLLKAFPREIWFRVAKSQEDFFMQIIRCKAWSALIIKMGRSLQARVSLSMNFWWLEHWADSLIGDSEDKQRLIRYSSVYIYHVFHTVQHLLAHRDRETGVYGHCRGLSRCAFRVDERPFNRMNFMPAERKFMKNVDNLKNLGRIWFHLDQRNGTGDPRRRASVSKSLKVGYAGFVPYEEVVEMVSAKLKRPASLEVGDHSRTRSSSSSHNRKSGSRKHLDEAGRNRPSKKGGISATGRPQKRGIQGETTTSSTGKDGEKRPSPNVSPPTARVSSDLLRPSHKRPSHSSSAGKDGGGGVKHSRPKSSMVIPPQAAESKTKASLSAQSRPHSFETALRESMEKGKPPQRRSPEVSRTQQNSSKGKTVTQRSGVHGVVGDKDRLNVTQNKDQSTGCLNPSTSRREDRQGGKAPSKNATKTFSFANLGDNPRSLEGASSGTVSGRDVSTLNRHQDRSNPITKEKTKSSREREPESHVIEKVVLSRRHAESEKSSISDRTNHEKKKRARLRTTVMLDRYAYHQKGMAELESQEESQDIFPPRRKKMRLLSESDSSSSEMDVEGPSVSGGSNHAPSCDVRRESIERAPNKVSDHPEEASDDRMETEEGEESIVESSTNEAVVVSNSESCPDPNVAGGSSKEGEPAARRKEPPPLRKEKDDTDATIAKGTKMEGDDIDDEDQNAAVSGDGDDEYSDDDILEVKVIEPEVLNFVISSDEEEEETKDATSESKEAPSLPEVKKTESSTNLQESLSTAAGVDTEPKNNAQKSNQSSVANQQICAISNGHSGEQSENVRELTSPSTQRLPRIVSIRSAGIEKRNDNVRNKTMSTERESIANQQISASREQSKNVQESMVRSSDTPRLPRIVSVRSAGNVAEKRNDVCNETRSAERDAGSQKGGKGKCNPQSCRACKGLGGKHDTNISTQEEGRQSVTPYGSSKEKDIGTNLQSENSGVRNSALPTGDNAATPKDTPSSARAVGRKRKAPQVTKDDPDSDSDESDGEFGADFTAEEIDEIERQLPGADRDDGWEVDDDGWVIDEEQAGPKEKGNMTTGDETMRDKPVSSESDLDDDNTWKEKPNEAGDGKDEAAKKRVIEDEDFLDFLSDEEGPAGDKPAVMDNDGNISDGLDLSEIIDHTESFVSSQEFSPKRKEVNGQKERRPALARMKSVPIVEATAMKDKRTEQVETLGIISSSDQSDIEREQQVSRRPSEQPTKEQNKIVPVQNKGDVFKPVESINVIESSDQTDVENDDQINDTGKKDADTDIKKQKDNFILNLLDNVSSEEDDDDDGGWLTGEEDQVLGVEAFGEDLPAVSDDGWVEGVEDEKDEEEWECSQGFDPVEGDMARDQMRHKVPTGRVTGHSKKSDKGGTSSSTKDIAESRTSIKPKSFYKFKPPKKTVPRQPKRTHGYSNIPNAQHLRIQKRFSAHQQVSKNAVPLGRRSLVTGQKSKNQRPQEIQSVQTEDKETADIPQESDESRVAPTVKSSGYRSNRAKGLIETFRQAEVQKDGSSKVPQRNQAPPQPFSLPPRNTGRSLLRNNSTSGLGSGTGDGPGDGNKDEPAGAQEDPSEKTGTNRTGIKPGDPRMGPRIGGFFDPSKGRNARRSLYENFDKSGTSKVSTGAERPKEGSEDQGKQKATTPSGSSRTLSESWTTAFRDIPDDMNKKAAPSRRNSDVLSDILKASTETQKDLRQGRQRPCIQALSRRLSKDGKVAPASNTTQIGPKDKPSHPPSKPSHHQFEKPHLIVKPSHPSVQPKPNPKNDTPQSREKGASYQVSNCGRPLDIQGSSSTQQVHPTAPIATVPGLEKSTAESTKLFGSPDKRPAIMNPSKPLTVDQFLGWVLSWSVGHMTENITRESTKILEGCDYKKILEVPNSFESMDQYYATFLPLKMIQIWNDVRRVYLKLGGERTSNAVLSESFRWMYEGRVYEKCCFKVSTSTSTDDPAPEKLPQKCELVVIKPDNTDSFEPIFGYVEEAVMSTAAAFYSNRQTSDLSLVVRILGDANFKSHCVQLQPLMSFGAYIHQICAFCRLDKSSVLAPSILSPTRKDVFCIEDVRPLAPNIYKETYSNAEQASFICGAFRAIQASYGVPRICMLQGPPGSGKTRTLSNLVACLLRNALGVSGQTPIQPKILLCAPTDVALDNLLSHLWKILRKEKTSESRRDAPAGLPFFVLRLGDVKYVSPTYKQFVLEKIVADIQAKQETKIQDLRKKIGEFEMHEQSVDSKMQVTRADKDLLRELEKEREQIRRRRVVVKDEMDRELKSRNEFNPEKARADMMSLADIICCKVNDISSPELQGALRRAASSPWKVTFSCAIIDEACQCLEVDTILPLYSSITKLVLAGDPHELKPKMIPQISRRFKLTQSLFTRLWMNFQGSLCRPVRMLTDQHVCHPEIYSFPNKTFYNNKIRSSSNACNKEDFKMMPYLIFNLLNSEEKEISEGDFNNAAEVELVQGIMACIQRQRLAQVAVAIISPYTEQRKLLQQRLGDQPGLYIGDVDGLQGKIKDIVIMSCVRTESSPRNLGFLDDCNKLNVALTRAQFSVFIVGNFKVLPEINTLWSSLFRDARQRELYVDVLDMYIRKLSENCVKENFHAYKALRQGRRGNTNQEENAIQDPQV